MEGFSIINWLIETAHLPKHWESYQHIAMSSLVVIIIAALSIVTWLKLRDTEKNIVPSDKVTVPNLFDAIVSWLIEMLEQMMGPAGRRHLPLISALFIYILISNLIGIIPGFSPPTSNINTNLGCAIVVFFYYNYVGIKSQGFVNYFKHMFGPSLWLAPLLFFIEIIGHLIRPLSLSIRLFGNMTGDHKVIGVFSHLVPILLPVGFMALAIFIAFIQAFVFTLLSAVYISIAMHADEE